MLSASAVYPERIITNILVWSAGGGTDTCNRVVMAEMSKILGVTINVVNKTGGVGGSVGMNDVFSQTEKNYEICNSLGCFKKAEIRIVLPVGSKSLTIIVCENCKPKFE